MWKREVSCCFKIFLVIRWYSVMLMGALPITLLIFLVLGSIPARAEKVCLRLGVLPCSAVVKTYENFLPLAVYLQRHIGCKVEVIVPKDFVEFENFVKDKKVDFTFQAPDTYVRLAYLYNRQVLLKALTPEGKVSYRGDIVVRHDSGITRVEELKGKAVLFGSKLSTAKWIAARDLLREKGININKDLKRYANGTSCESIALSVYLKDFDAGALCDYSFTEINSPGEEEAAIPANQLMVIGQIWLVPTWVMAFSRDMAPVLVVQVKAALLALNHKKREDMKIMQPLEVGGFVSAQDSDYDGIRKKVGLEK